MRIIYDSSENSDDFIIKNYFDKNWTNDHITRKSISNFIFILNDNLISWYLKKQVIIALSLIKIEYIMVIFIIKEIIQLSLLLSEVDILDKDSQYTKIKIIQNIEKQQIKVNAIGQE